ncbi:MAG: hypothetical protein V7K98_01825 [Nostoc sp.]
MKNIDPQEAINRSLYEALIIVKTAIYRVSCLNRIALGDKAVQQTLTNPN